MNHSEQVTCSGQVDGLPCPRPAAITTPFPICQQHRVEIAMAVNREVLGREMSSLLAIPTSPLPRPDSIEVGSLLEGPHEEVVYFIANGGQVKIGFTTNLKSRLSSLSLRRDNMLTALEGGADLEQALHGHFAEHRRGNTEWFHLAPEIVRYITEVSKNPRAAIPKQADEADAPARQEVPEFEPEEPTDILMQALQIVDESGLDRITREQLAARLTSGNQDLLRAYMRQAGAGMPHTLRVNGLPARGWYRSDIEKAVESISAPV